MAAPGYIKINKRDIAKYRSYRPAAHALFFSHAEHTGLQRVMANLRFDGFVGFPGGFVEKHERMEDGLNRELREEINIRQDMFTSDDLFGLEIFLAERFLLGSYIKIVSPPELVDIEEQVFDADDMGTETLGVLSIPVATAHDMANVGQMSLIGNAYQQLLEVVNSHRSMPTHPIDVCTAIDNVGSDHERQCYIAICTKSERKLFGYVPTNGYLLVLLNSDFKFTLPAFTGSLANPGTVSSIKDFLKYLGLSGTVHATQDQMVFVIEPDEDKFLRVISKQAFRWARQQYADDNAIGATEEGCLEFVSSFKYLRVTLPSNGCIKSNVESLGIQIAKPHITGLVSYIRMMHNRSSFEFYTGHIGIVTLGLFDVHRNRSKKGLSHFLNYQPVSNLVKRAIVNIQGYLGIPNN